MFQNRQMYIYTTPKLFKYSIIITSDIPSGVYFKRNNTMLGNKSNKALVFFRQEFYNREKKIIALDPETSTRGKEFPTYMVKNNKIVSFLFKRYSNDGIIA